MGLLPNSENEFGGVWEWWDASVTGQAAGLWVYARVCLYI